MGDQEDGKQEEMGEHDIEKIADENESEKEATEWGVHHFFSLHSLHRAGSMSSLPHHISTANEIKTIANQIERFLAELPDPVHITLATSRSHRYLPDSQANVIHGLCEDLLGGLYDTTNICRWDKPKFSVDNVPVEDMEKMMARDILDICEPKVCSS